MNLSLWRRFLCHFRGVSCEFLARHPREAPYLTTNAFALAIPVAMAAVNGWILATHAGASVPVRLGVVASLGTLVYFIERVLLAMIGTGQRVALAILFRCAIAASLALLLGETVTSQVFFSNDVAAFYRRQKADELAAARGFLEQRTAAAIALREPALKPFNLALSNKQTALKHARDELAAAYKALKSAESKVYSEEEGEAASGLEGFGDRAKDKKKRYLDPAQTRVDAATKKLQKAEAELGEATGSLRTATEQSQTIGGDEIKIARDEYDAVRRAILEEQHHDLGSRLRAMVTLSIRDPVIGMGWLCVMIVFVGMDFIALLLKSKGRTAGYDLEERREHEVRAARVAAETEKAKQAAPLIAEIKSRDEYQIALMTSALAQGVVMIDKVVEFQQAVFERRQTVVEARDRDVAAGQSDAAEIHRQCLHAIDRWAALALSRVTAQGGTATS
jgi:hypothetical protein